MIERVARRPLPVSHSIHWMPVRESHHVVASLQPGNGGRRQLFVHQHVLATLREVTSRIRDRRIVGLLRGGLCECPATAVSYLTIDSVSDHSELRDQAPVAAFRDVLESTVSQPTRRIVGWFYVTHMDETLPRGFGEDVAASAAQLLQRWQPTLVMTSGSRGADGAFLLWDGVESRAFRSPFYELLDGRAMGPNAPKPTQMIWPSYATGDLVAPAPLPSLGRPEAARPDAAPASGQSPSRWTFWRARPRESHRPRRTGEHTEGSTSAPSLSHPTAPTGHSAERRATPDATPAQPAPRRQPKPNVEQGDTAEGDSIERYIAIARKDGFNIATTFDVEVWPGERETLWVLQDPYAGLLLTVVANNSRVLEASLHYNVHVSDPEALQSVFSEHRNDEARVIYVRESSIDQLRARSERARATGELQREWRVTPTIYFVTPSEWESVAAADDAAGPARAIEALNRRRIAAIADSITSRFGLRAPGEDQ
jgi:hypothetical protein